MATTDVKNLLSGLRSLQNPDTLEQPLRKELYNVMRDLLPSLEDPQDTANRIAYTPLQLTIAKVGSDLSLFEILTTSESPMSVAELSKLTHCDPVLLGRLLRYLATHGMVRETGEGTFAAINVTKSLSAPGFKAGIVHNFDSLMPCWQHLPAFLKDTEYKNPSDVMHTPFQIGHSTEQPAFVWALSQPQRVQNFNLWMTATHEGQKSWLDVYPPENFCRDSDENACLFVDIGGGVGHQCAALKAHLSKAGFQGRVVLQDLPMAIEHALPTEGVEKTVFDFLGEQPIKGARAYYLRNIIHDYPDEKCVELLHRTMNAMDKKSLLLIDDMIVPNVRAHWRATQQDLTMMSGLASMERSEKQWRALLEKAGLKVLQMSLYTEETHDGIIVAVPV